MLLRSVGQLVLLIFQMAIQLISGTVGGSWVFANYCLGEIHLVVMDDVVVTASDVLGKVW